MVYIDSCDPYVLNRCIGLCFDNITVLAGLKCCLLGSEGRGSGRENTQQTQVGV